MFWKKKYEDDLYKSLGYQFNDLDESLIKNWVFYQLRWYGNRATTYRLYSRLHTGLSLASPAIASLGISAPEGSRLKTATMYFNVVCIIALGVLTSMRCTEQWIRYRTVCEKLKRLTVEYLYSTQTILDNRNRREACSIFLEQIDSLIGEELDEWSKLELQQVKESHKQQKCNS